MYRNFDEPKNEEEAKKRINEIDKRIGFLETQIQFYNEIMKRIEELKKHRELWLTQKNNLTQQGG